MDAFSVDAVLIYAQRGSGKRASLYTDYPFAVWEDDALRAGVMREQAAALALGAAVCFSASGPASAQEKVSISFVTVEEDPLSLDGVVDWVTKYRLIERYRARHDLPLTSPRIAQLDLAYHDIHRGRGLYYLLEKRGAVARVTSDIEVFQAKSVPPQTTRARLRGEFIRQAQEKRRDFTVDWVHLKLNDQAQRTVLCKDPFKAVDERVDKLIASM